MKARAAAIITDYRTGGSFLSLALDSHPLVYCARAEPLSKTSQWWEEIGGTIPILRIIWSAEMCKVACVKLIYRQVGDNVWALAKRKNAKIIHLVRRNELRSGCSFLFHKRIHRNEVSRRGQRRKLHVYTPVVSRTLRPRPMKLPVDDLMHTLVQRRVARERMATRITNSGLRHMTLTYEDMVGGEMAEAARIRKDTALELCRFLKVRSRVLRAATRKVNAYPLRLLISNWREVREIVSDSEWAPCLELEDKWQKTEAGVWTVG